MSERILVISGSDCSGGAGLQTDIKCADRLDVFAASCVTCVTVQNGYGVSSVNPVDTYVICQQIEAVFESFTPKAVKIGMLPSPIHVEAVNNTLSKLIAQNNHFEIPVILDPILAPTKGSLVTDNQKRSFISVLYDLAAKCYMITPNLSEFLTMKEYGLFTPDVVDSYPDKLPEYILVTGGHDNIVNDASDDNDSCIDRLYDSANKNVSLFSGQYIDTVNTHGTGCLLSTAIACNIAKGMNAYDAVRAAKQFLIENLRASKYEKWGGNYGPALTPHRKAYM